MGQATYKLIINNAVLDNILSYSELRKKKKANNCQGVAVLEAHTYTAWLKATIQPAANLDRRLFSDI